MIGKRESCVLETGTLRPGVVLDDRYKILRPLGLGGMGRIWEAEDMHLERSVAVKVLRSSLSEERGPRSLFAREAKLLARLEHPGVVRIYESVTEGPFHYLVTQLIDGENLADLVLGLRRKLGGAFHARPSRRLEAGDLAQLLGRPVPRGVSNVLVQRSWCRTVAAIAAGIGQALEAVHGCGVIHRDIKGSNVVLTGGGHPVLIDFGLGGGMGFDRDTVGGGLSGTLRNLAPEQLRRQRMGDDPRTDIYQLGLLLYEMLTLREAFEGMEPSVVVGGILKGRFARPRELDRGVPVSLESICLKAMAREPECRYQTAGEMRRELEAFTAWRSGRFLARRFVAWTRRLGSPQNLEVGVEAGGA